MNSISYNEAFLLRDRLMIEFQWGKQPWEIVQLFNTALKGPCSVFLLLFLTLFSKTHSYFEIRKRCYVFVQIRKEGKVFCLVLK